MEEFHRDVFYALTDEAGDVDAEPVFPSSYPTSCLLGCVDMVECITVADFSTWPTLPSAARDEASIHDSGNLLLFENHRRLVVPQRMSGQHKCVQRLAFCLRLLRWASELVHVSHPLAGCGRLSTS